MRNFEDFEVNQRWVGTILPTEEAKFLCFSLSVSHNLARYSL